jgi:hypothetical protein
MTVDVPPQSHNVAPPEEPHGIDLGVTAKFPALSAARRRAEPAPPAQAAAALIELALHESNAPVDALSGALTRMTQLLHGDWDAGDDQHHRDRLAREIAVCVENLQFHDRLTQQLTQVRNLLASLASNGVSVDTSGRPTQSDEHSWQMLLENLRARFTSDSHRILFNLLLPSAGGRTSVPPPHANEGSVELF